MLAHVLAKALRALHQMIGTWSSPCAYLIGHETVCGKWKLAMCLMGWEWYH